MEYKLKDIINVQAFQALLDGLNAVSPFATAVLDNDCKVLIASGWQPICTEFHRVNPETEKLCQESDKYILSHIERANPSCSYKCQMGIIDSATPIIIEGKHLGNVFVGQLFLEKPDVEYFRKQAARYGFDEEAYLDALSKVPVLTKDQL